MLAHLLLTRPGSYATSESITRPNNILILRHVTLHITSFLWKHAVCSIVFSVGNMDRRLNICETSMLLTAGAGSWNPPPFHRRPQSAKTPSKTVKSYKIKGYNMWRFKAPRPYRWIPAEQTSFNLFSTCKIHHILWFHILFLDVHILMSEGPASEPKGFSLCVGSWLVEYWHLRFPNFDLFSLCIFFSKNVSLTHESPSSKTC